jgi:O-antigen ligase
LEKIFENPFLGIGPMNLAWDTLNHPHNSVLQWAAEWGVISLIFLLFCVLYALKTWLTLFSGDYLRKENNLEKNNVTVTLTFTILSGLGYSLVSGVIVMPLSQLMLFTTFGIMMGLYQNCSAVGSLSQFKFEVLFTKIFILLATILFIYSIIATGIFNNVLNQNFNLSDINITAPRLWRIGGIPHH